jgi:two-component system nitrate/nitrite response regulator NarL
MVCELNRRITVGVCDTQPVLVEGLRSVLTASGFYHLLNCVRSLDEVDRLTVSEAPRIVVLDKALGASVLLDWLARPKNSTQPAYVLWCASVSEAESLRFLKAGATGILRKTACPETLLACFDAVANGRTWMDDMTLRGRRSGASIHSELTPREQQVLELVEQGLRNKEIARELGIRPGTVKIHLKHIFEKTGIHGRYGLAISGLRDRGMIPMKVA